MADPRRNMRLNRNRRRTERDRRLIERAERNDLVRSAVEKQDGRATADVGGKPFGRDQHP